MPKGIPTKMKRCKICNELFLPSYSAQTICDKDHIVSCPICGKPMIWNSTAKIPPCSKECKRILRRQNNMKKYGVDHPMKLKEVREKQYRTMKDRYGVEHALQSSELKNKAMETNSKKFGTDWAIANEEVHNRAKETMKKKYGAPTTLQSKELRKKYEYTMNATYGVSNPMKCEEIRNKSKDTLKYKYGVDNPMKCEEIRNRMSNTIRKRLPSEWEDIKNKCKTTWMNNLGVDNPSKDKQVIDKITDTFLRKYGVKRAIEVPEFRNKMINTMIERYGVPYFVQDLKGNQGKISNINKKFAKKLEERNIPYELEFPLGNKNFDFHILGTNLLIEIDPTYTHNIIGNHWNKNGINPNYHLNKSQLAEDNGYHCIHIFDWDDEDKIIDIIEPNKRIIYARKTNIYHIDNKYADEFLNKNHIQGTCKGMTLCLGLVYEDELVQLMTFGPSRYSKSHSMELLRLCSLPHVRVIGGASKLFSYAVNYYELDNIISYCDRSKFNGGVYSNIGMIKIRDTSPQEVWSYKDRRITANLLRQRGFDQLFNTNYGKNTSNDRLMIENGWLPVFDCGQYVYEYRINNRS